MKNTLLFSFLTLSFSFHSLLAQRGHTGPAPEIIVSQITHPVALDPFVRVALDSTHASGFRNLSLESGGEKLDYEDSDNFIPLESTSYTHYYTFHIFNDKKDSASFFIYIEPQASIQLYTITPAGNIINNLYAQLDDGFLMDREFYKLDLAPGQTLRFVIRIEFPRIRYNELFFWIGPYDQYTDFVRFNMGLVTGFIFYDSIFFGMIAMMLVYMIAKYIQIRRLEYLYYAGYAFFFSSFFFMKLMDTMDLLNLFSSPFMYSLFYIEFQLLAYWMYYLFAQQFLSTAIVFPRAHKLINLTMGCIIAFAIVDLVLFFIPAALVLRWQLWDLARVALAISGLAFTISFAFIGNSLSRYLVIGGSTLAFFAMLSMLFSSNQEWILHWPAPFNNALTYFEIGILSELLFFALGLGHKNKMDEIEKVEAKESLKLAVEQQHVRHLHALSEVQEQERSRFAKDLHDGLGGMLWGVKLSLSNMKGNMILTGDHVQVFERSLDMLDSSIHELRRVAHNLMPETLVKFGLAAALKDFCDFVDSAKAVKVIFQQVGKEKKLDISIEIVLYRVANELVNNALRHATASQLLVQLNYDEQFLTLTVEDNGIGFDQAILNKTTGSGWPNIKSRIEYLKGNLDIETSPGNGTSVYITIPI